jgi:hypothetical protein
MKQFLGWIGLKEKLHEAEHRSRIRVAPDGSRFLDRARVSSQLPKLPSKKVMIVDAPRGSNSSSIEENLGFWIDEAAKTLVLADGASLTVRRFDERWISAARGDMSYEFDRQNGNLTYASSTTKEGIATIIIGAGRCKIAVGPAG